MGIDLDLQYAVDAREAADYLPAEEDFRCWVDAILTGRREEAELTIRLVGAEEGTALNETYRHKSGPTNVLSFPYEAPAGVELPLLGDIVICAPVVAREARDQGKPPVAHWAHMTVHGVLHLLGYDHTESGEAQTMEDLERVIMGRLGYPDPYEERPVQPSFEISTFQRRTI